MRFCGLVAADTCLRNRLVGAKVGHRPVGPGGGYGGGPFYLGSLMGDLLSERRHTPCESESKRPTSSACEGDALTGVCFRAD